MQWEEFWWNNITGARTVVDRVTMALKTRKMALVAVPSDLPWRYSMRSAVQTAFIEQTNFRDIIIETIDAVDDNPTELEPGRLILQKYASPEIRAGYREKSRKSIQDYIFEHGKVTTPDSKLIECINFKECISSYDVQQLNSFVLSEQKDLSNEWKRYISTVTAVVCGTDAEISELLLRTINFRTDTVIDGIRRIVETGDFDRRGADDDSDHPLWYCRHNNMSELLHRTWVA